MLQKSGCSCHSCWMSLSKLDKSDTVLEMARLRTRQWQKQESCPGGRHGLVTTDLLPSAWPGSLHSCHSGGGKMFTSNKKVTFTPQNTFTSKQLFHLSMPHKYVLFIYVSPCVLCKKLCLHNYLWIPLNLRVMTHSRTQKLWKTTFSLLDRNRAIIQEHGPIRLLPLYLWSRSSPWSPGRLTRQWPGCACVRWIIEFYGVVKSSLTLG